MSIYDSCTGKRLFREEVSEMISGLYTHNNWVIAVGPKRVMILDAMGKVQKSLVVKGELLLAYGLVENILCCPMKKWCMAQLDLG